MTTSSSAKYYYKKFNSTILNDLWPELWFFSSVAASVCCINKYTEVNFTLSTTLLTVLGTVLGLVISFRTTSAYDRYWERSHVMQWGSGGNIALASRNLGMIIWIHIPIKRKAKEGENADEVQIRAIIERKSMMNLVQAFPVSVKHYLRSEPGIYYEDLYPLISFLPHSVDGSHKGRETEASTSKDSDDAPASLPMWQQSHLSTARAAKSRKKHVFDPEKVLPNVKSTVPLAPARNPPKETIYDAFPPAIIFLPIHTMIKRLLGTRRGDEYGSRNMFGKKKEPEPIESNIPLEISLFLSSYMAVLMRDGLLTPAMATGYNNALVSMQDAVTNLQRIRTTPIPFAYQVHLRVCVWLYLLFLPLMIYPSFKWLTIPCTAFACLLYVGFLEIGQSIENPFQYEENDLDLDHFCLQIQRELAEITAHPAPDPASFIFSHTNQPFAPSDRRSAIEILTDKKNGDDDDRQTLLHVRQTLVKNYQEISQATFNHKRY
ncbi:hypothetical protein FRC04_000315 [Tulasnella sp. 424]|nr:hypothetical protein FRC04_000315 [Tulasnella sp. 424]KAG8982178.1 hypothetical protein FRC05_000320 [Tulasnella sp. 425]